MESDRNLRFTIELSDFPEFSRVRLWTLGIRDNAGMIRARFEAEWYPKRGVFEPCPFSASFKAGYHSGHSSPKRKRGELQLSLTLRACMMGLTTPIKVLPEDLIC